MTGTDRRSRRTSRAASSRVSDPCVSCAWPDDHPDEDDSPAPGLDDLIRAGMHERGWSYSDLERASDRALTRGRWQQLGSGVPQRKFPDPASLTVIARVLEVDTTTVVLAAARSLGLDVGRRRAELAHLLPVHTDADLGAHARRDPDPDPLRGRRSARRPRSRGLAVGRSASGVRPAPPPQPLPVEQVGPGEIGPDGRALELRSSRWRTTTSSKRASPSRTVHHR